MSDTQNANVSVGLWKKTFQSDNGVVNYATGRFRLGDLLNLTDNPDDFIQVSYFPNKNKKEAKSPDASLKLRVYVQREAPPQGGGYRRAAPQAQTRAAVPKARPAPPKRQVNPLEDEEVPETPSAEDTELY